MLARGKNQPAFSRRLLMGCLLVGWMASGCGSPKKLLQVEGLEGAFEAGRIISTRDLRPVSFEEMVADLAAVRVVYVGEVHSDRRHHAVQLEIIRALHQVHPDLVVGMEMFDHTYQEVLDRWSAGGMDSRQFVRQTHWYANWRYDFDLYREILEYTEAARIPLVALNIPFHIPPKIAAGGLASLGAEDRRHLPQSIDTSNAGHRAYVKEVYDMHHMKGAGDFEAFYEAQCAWEDVMAEAVALAARRAPVVVLAGNGHIIHKFGIPDRAYALGKAPFRTVYPVAPGREAALDQGDYIWLSP